MPQDWFAQFQTATAPEPSAGGLSTAARAGAMAPAPIAPADDFFAQFQTAPAASGVRVPTSFARINGQLVPNEPDEPEPVKPWLDTAVNYVKNIGTSMNPLPALKALYEVGEASQDAPWYVKALGPAGTLAYGVEKTGLAGGLVRAQTDEFTKGKKAYDEGRYSEAIGHTIAGVVPLMGPGAAEAGEMIGAGDVSGGLGRATGLLGSLALGPALKGMKLHIPAIAPNANPVAAAAVESAQRAGVPIDAATATGNSFVTGAQKLAEKVTLLGAREAGKFEATQAQGMTDWGRRLAARTGAGPVTTEQAGAAIPAAIETRISDLSGKADTSYAALRTIEADPKFARTIQTGTKTSTVLGANGQPVVLPVTKSVPLAADMTPVKAALQPVYDRMLQTMPITQRDASPGLLAIKNLLDGPDAVPLSVADANLSTIKGIVRKADSPDLRNLSQGLGAKALTDLSRAIDVAATTAGPEAVKALREGRAAVRAKYAAADVLKTLQDEPVKVAGQLTARNDTAIKQLRQVQALAPAELPKLARAYLDGLVDKATAGGGFTSGAALDAEWSKLGKGTKQALFQNPTYVKELDHFFSIAKKLGKDPNPSGSGYMGGILLHGANGWLLHNPIAAISQELTGLQMAKALHSPAGVRALTKGMTVNLGSPAAAASAYSNILARIGEGAAAGGRLAPALAGDPTRPTQ